MPRRRGRRHRDSASSRQRATPSRACTCWHLAQAREEGRTASCPNNSMQSSWISFAFFTILLEYSLCAFRSVTSNFPHLIRFSISVDVTIGLEQRSAGASRKGACEETPEEDGNRAPIEEKRQASVRDLKSFWAPAKGRPSARDTKPCRAEAARGRQSGSQQGPNRTLTSKIARFLPVFLSNY